MKTFLLLLVLAVGKHHTDQAVAYVCMGAKKYHLSSTCRGLSGCQHKIIKMAVKEAQKSGKTLCRWER